MTDEQTSLALKLRHRELLSELGTEALRTRDLDPLLDRACHIVAAGMDEQYCKILEYRPNKDTLLVRAGVGWHAGVVGHAELPGDSGSPAGHALKTGEPVICNDLATEERFSTPALLVEHGVRRAMNVIIRGDDAAFGVLETDSRQPGAFAPDDIAFMQAAANLIGVAVERWRRVNELEGALSTHGVLLREADHRIKNSLQLVASLLSLQRSKLTDAGALAAIDSAISRVGAVAETHRALNRSNDLRTVGFGKMLADLCAHTAQLNPLMTVQCGNDAALPLDAERAIPLGLIVSELLTNASRHAYPEGQPGTIEARAVVDGELLNVSVADVGVGVELPQTPRPGTLGSTIVQALSRQIGAEIRTISQAGQGTTVQVRLPLRAPSQSI